MIREPGNDPNRSRGSDGIVDAERQQEIARGLFRESNDALFLFDPDTHHVLDVNPIALRLTGFTKVQALSMRLWDIFAGDSPRQLEPMIEAYRRTGFYHSREGFTLNRKDGQPIPVNVSVSRIHTRPTPLGLVVARDVSERKRVELALRESEGQYRRLIETAKVVFWTLWSDGRITSLNPQFATITGWTCDAWTGRPLADLIVPEDRPAATRWIAGAATGELPPTIELKVANRQGESNILEFLATAVLPENGGFSLSGIARDVTENRKMAEALKRAETQERARFAAESADRAKSEFLARFSHEIRTPLTSILGFTDVLLGDPDVLRLPAERVEDLKIIERNGEHLLAIISDILDMSEVEAGKLRISLVPCSLMAIAKDVAESLAVRAESKGLTIQIETKSPAPAVVLTDPVRLRQILMNLVGNAIKFTNFGQITLRLGVIDEAGTSLAIVEVVDNGIGLSAEAIPHLFEPFYRVPGTTTKGSGLGLAISRQLAEALGGRITVESEPGCGTTFRLLIPRSNDMRPDPKSSDLNAAETRYKIPESLDAHILLAEDNPAIQRVTALHLERLGAKVALARNGEEAVEAVIRAQEANLPFDVVLMDMQMPVLDGYEATRQLRAHGYAGTIIALTAYAMPEDRDESLRLGCDEHLSKPIDWGRLAWLIGEFLGQQSRSQPDG